MQNFIRGIGAQGMEKFIVCKDNAKFYQRNWSTRNRKVRRIYSSIKNANYVFTKSFEPLKEMQRCKPAAKSFTTVKK